MYSFLLVFRFVFFMVQVFQVHDALLSDEIVSTKKQRGGGGRVAGGGPGTAGSMIGAEPSGGLVRPYRTPPEAGPGVEPRTKGGGTFNPGGADFLRRLLFLGTTSTKEDGGKGG